MIADGTVISLSRGHSLNTEDKIAAFGHLTDGWSYGEGSVFSERTMDIAMRLARGAIAEGFLETDVFPGLNGEIMLAIYTPHSTTLELVVNDDDSIYSCIETRDGQRARAESLTIDQAFQKISELKRECTSFGHLTHTITTGIGGGLSVPHFAIAEGSLFSMRHARLKPAEISAHILVDSTGQLPEPLRFFAGYTEKYSPALAS